MWRSFIICSGGSPDSPDSENSDDRGNLDVSGKPSKPFQVSCKESYVHRWRVLESFGGFWRVITVRTVSIVRIVSTAPSV